MLELVREVFR